MAWVLRGMSKMITGIKQEETGLPVDACILETDVYNFHWVIRTGLLEA